MQEAGFNGSQVRCVMCLESTRVLRVRARSMPTCWRMRFRIACGRARRQIASSRACAYTQARDGCGVCLAKALAGVNMHPCSASGERSRQKVAGALMLGRA